MKKAGDILADILGGIHFEGEAFVSFFNSWEKIAGTDISNHSHLSDLKNGILYVEVDHPGWMQLIQLKKREILKKTRTMYPQLEIKDIRIFLVKDRKKLPSNGGKHAGNEDKEGKSPFKEIIDRLGGVVVDNDDNDELTQ